MTKLLFDYFIWLDADSLFVRNPRNVLECLGKSPIHVPLTTNLSAVVEKCEKEHNDSSVAPARGERGDPAISETLVGLNPQQYVRLMRSAGVYNPVYLSASSFWIVQREAIDRVVELATHFRAFAKQKGATVGVSACLGYTMQMLCADPEAHRLKVRPDLWASDDQNHFRGSLPQHTPWMLKDRLADKEYAVNPCIIHQQHSKNFGPDQEQSAGEPEKAISAAEKEKMEYAPTF
jgi:hypothetical protein